ncbi:putative ferric-chelate reductase 1 [Oncorhynchus tshawytscha]|uniref:putative ferric-chelate reductase 1 n=1 Tax=Oncorhynchus tshawytscha TaxID=74940 RepID=UPI000D098A6E|nr:putative ferric-chelate reductase 1 [Oncorhynchus tshawytscha]XP_024291837.1 putative ferric-chelate reductase 1 [Oncorhynchus tshawytscha]
MDRGLLFVASMVMGCLAPGVSGNGHLSYANNTEVNITRTGCGLTKLCVETPEQCDPTGKTSCLFASIVTTAPSPPNGVDLSVELLGDSSGYIALGLTANETEGTSMVFICAQNRNGSFFFCSAQRNNLNNTISLTQRIVKNITGSVNGTFIKCKFMLPAVNATTRTSHVTTFVTFLAVGNVRNGMGIGDINIRLTNEPLNLADPTSNVAATTTTTAGSSALTSQAVMVLLSVLMYRLS